MSLELLLVCILRISMFTLEPFRRNRRPENPRPKLLLSLVAFLWISLGLSQASLAQGTSVAPALTGYEAYPLEGLSVPGQGEILIDQHGVPRTLVEMSTELADYTVIPGLGIALKFFNTLTGDPGAIVMMTPGASGAPEFNELETFRFQYPLNPGPRVDRALVLGFHSFNVSEKQMFSMSNTAQECAERGWFLLAPLGFTQINFATEHSQRAVMKALELVDVFFDFNVNRIYAAGFSMGGTNAVSFAARHLDYSTYRVAGVLNHTGTKDIVFAYNQFDAKTQGFFENPLVFGGAPLALPFAYARVSPFVQVLPGTIGQDFALLSNIIHLPIYHHINLDDPNLELVSENALAKNFWLSRGVNMLVDETTDGAVHDWGTLDFDAAFDWLGGFSLDAGYPDHVELYVDRPVPYFYTVPRGIHADTVGRYHVTIDAPMNSFVFDTVKFITEVAFDLAAMGLNPLETLTVEHSSIDVGADTFVLTGYPFEPSSVLTDGVAPSAWAYDAMESELSVTPTATGVLSTTVIVPAAPAVEFAASVNSGPTPLSVDFTDMTTGPVTSWLWDFGDMGTSTLPNPTHIFASDGIYDVSLTATGPGGVDSLTKVGFVVAGTPAPIAEFSATPLTGADPLLVSFSDESLGPVTSWLWDFGDTNTSFDPNPTHTYLAPGTYTVTLTATGPGGVDDETKVDYITVSPPMADFSATPLSGVAPHEVTFSDLTSGGVNAWSWDFGDLGTSSDQNPVYTYNTPGTYAVSLTATGPAGVDTETKLAYITVLEPAPVAEFSGTPLTGVGAASVNFTDLSVGVVTDWAWDFGDTNMSTDQNPSHTYVAPGSYTVTLTVTGPGGVDAETKVGYVVVTDPPPIANFIGIPTSGTAPLAVTFTDLSTGAITDWLWDFGDTNSSTSASPMHTYTTPGTYTVTLTVTGPGGSDPETKVDYVVVSDPPPVADFSANVTSGVAPLAVTFTDLSTGAITDWLWDFGDTNSSTSASPMHTYTTPGTYTVTLTVTGPGGSDPETKVDYVVVSDPPPVADFSANVTSGVAPLAVTFTDLSTGAITDWLWDFGDTNSSTSASPMHTYTTPGTYTVTLTVTGPGGSDPETKVDYVVVSDPPPVADFSANVTSGVAPLAVTFTDLSTGAITDWLWDFGDTNSSTSASPMHTYTTPGTYTVTLTVTGPGGSDPETKVDYVVVS